MVLDILFTLLLVLLNGFFVAAEFSMVKVRSSQVELLVANGNPTARFAKHILDHLDAYLSATQLGITLASLGLGWIGESVVSEIILAIMGYGEVTASSSALHTDAAAQAHAIAIPISFALITVLHIVFGELAPKSLAIRFPTKTTLALAIPMRAVYIVFRPFIWLLNGFANAVLRGIGIKPVGHAESHSEEELRLLMSQSAQQGTIQSEKHELIENVFSFEDRKVRKIMVPRNKVVAVDVERSWDEMADHLVENGFSRIPVYQDNIDHIVGILYAKDLFRVMRTEVKPAIAEILRPMVFVPEGKRIGDLLREFQVSKTMMAIVVDEYGATSGIVTLEDILEELVGEIDDEYDQPDEDFIPEADGTWIVPGDTPISEINDDLPIPLPESNEYDSVAGLVIEIAGRIPDDGESFQLSAYEITCLATTDTTVTSIRLRLIDISDDEDAQ